MFTIAQVMGKVKELVSRAPPQLHGPPMLTGGLSPSQWQQLAAIQEDLHSEYTLRRRMLLTRLDATVQSFSWSTRLKAKEGEIAGLYG